MAAAAENEVEVFFFGGGSYGGSYGEVTGELGEGFGQGGRVQVVWEWGLGGLGLGLAEWDCERLL